ncbi:hypothetical protein GWG65_31020 [Bradyrhizobium sp. CSA207]|uniref:hypothetical protein n=1 Tax=Bradyrhizobium sp. CSA207 TaxID=2698826 RepID=UPI0023AED36E|nr:hypothetical protein [Bradyrhizobium sp. CSA207]MDE5445763.1 hypothetical protein [Bradyrhizobium sp. CSA207]
MLEFANGGSKPVVLSNSEQRRFLQDGNEITFRGKCHRSGYASIGLAPVSGRSRPPNSSLAARHPADAQGDVRWSAGPLVYAALISPFLELDEVRHGQLLTALAAVSTLILVTLISNLVRMMA